MFGTDFVLDGLSLDASLSLGEAFTILDREVTLSCLLADGSPFSYDLNLVNGTGADFLSAGATLTITLVTATPEVILGNCNQDGVVDFFDISPFIEILTSAATLEEADCNSDGEVNFFDIDPFVVILAGG